MESEFSYEEKLRLTAEACNLFIEAAKKANMEGGAFAEATFQLGIMSLIRSGCDLEEGIEIFKRCFNNHKQRMDNE